MAYEFIQIEPAHRPYIALVRLNRPKDLNALNFQLMEELLQAMLELNADPQVRVIVLTGNDRAFAAGADIKEMAGGSPISMLRIDQFSTWDAIYRTRKPIIAAVSGFAVGGGCELAMMCDMIIASETAKFGQPEIKIGVIPGAGGTQRLTRAIGKARAMEMVLTGKFISAEEAYQFGLVNRVVPVELYLEEAMKLAAEIAAMGPIATQMAKESIKKADEMHLQEALYFERKNFYMLFATEDQKEGMNAFVEKRTPDFHGK